jgi:hypothetical protein
MLFTSPVACFLFQMISTFYLVTIHIYIGVCIYIYIYILGCRYQLLGVIIEQIHKNHTIILSCVLDFGREIKSQSRCDC